MTPADATGTLLVSLFIAFAALLTLVAIGTSLAADELTGREPVAPYHRARMTVALLAAVIILAALIVFVWAFGVLTGPLLG